MVKEKPDPRAPIIGDWRGQPMYRCPFTETCAFDTLDEQAMTAHLDPRFGKHPVATEPAPVVRLSADERADYLRLRAAVEEAAESDATKATIQAALKDALAPPTTTTTTTAAPSEEE